MSDFAFTIVMLGMAALIAYIIAKDFENERNFRQYHDRDKRKL